MIDITNGFCSINVLEFDIECISFTVISIDSILEYESKNYLHVCLDKRFYKITNKWMTDYLDHNAFVDQIL